MWAGAAALVTAGWHLGPAASWLPAVRRVVSPALDGRGNPAHVALTFDDGPDPVSTPYFLEELGRLGARATFFVLGSRLERYPQLGRRIVTEGHELAVHGWQHERFWHPRPRRDLRDLARATGSVQRASGSRPLWYRPPYGVLTATRLAAARRLGLRPVLWTAWGRDWTATADADSVLAELAERMGGGATVLLHDSDHACAPRAWHSALEALPHLVMRCRAEGLTVGPLAEHGLRSA
ncbi:polysaccharide deacetylase [Streptomyces abyssalis]|uniref:Polysaccharide deacetylase n=1 Tax=Streptomyces abyssalis TaxID=933944 RepID=A0A1E7JV52_9ACTN|nr:polysaccharide deacetylase family protein [Streptomyces abyssalis]OEU89501.1 polysaccharide deacetylase [Streptomyces abyssalis]OEU93835.1 polysaccharide deacetylase [Streptomyces abyssalis]OEV29924.1 polysaccharide deacetylase [Streptomyces nanshensis]